MQNGDGGTGRSRTGASTAYLPLALHHIGYCPMSPGFRRARYRLFLSLVACFIACLLLHGSEDTALDAVLHTLV